MLKTILITIGTLAASLLLAWAVSSAINSSNSTSLQRAEAGVQLARLAAQRAARAASQSVKTHQLLAAIQAQRIEICEEQNRRHAKLEQTVQRQVDALKRTHPKRYLQAVRQHQQTEQIVNAIQPHFDCSRLKPPPPKS